MVVADMETRRHSSSGVDVVEATPLFCTNKPFFTRPFGLSSFYTLVLLFIFHSFSFITVPLSFHIAKAWMCEEANGEDLVYIEAIMPLMEEISPDVCISEEQVTVKG
jgi:hypothetical protein